MESERFLRRRGDANFLVLHYRDGVRTFLERLIERGWSVDYESDGQPLGLKKHLEAISLEPGSQWEISPSPQKTLHDLKALETKLDLEVRSVLDSDIEWWPMGLNTLESVDTIELLPSPRYALMDRHFSRLGGRGREMMRRTCGLQINFDFATELEGLSMLRTAFRLSPFLGTLFSNSVVRDRSGQLHAVSDRHLIWTQTDSARCGFLPGIFDSDFSLHHYCEFIAKMPLMYAYDLQGKAIDCEGRSLSELADFKGQNLIEANGLASCRQNFMESRLKPCCVEIRFLDQQPDAFRMAAIAMVTGLIYDEENREAIGSFTKSATTEHLRKLMERGARRGLSEEGIYPFCVELFQRAQRGLLERAFGEEIFLAPIEELLRSSLTVGEYLEACPERPLC